MMSLTPYLPPQSGESGAVFALLQVLADPAAAKKVLEKMEEARKAIDNATEKQREQFKTGEDDARRLRADQEKHKAEIEAKATKASSELNDAKAKLMEAERRKTEAEHAEKRVADQEHGIKERLNEMNVMQRQLEARSKEMLKREHDLERNEQKVGQREADLEMREKTLADDIAEHNKWLAGLKPPRTR